MNRVPAYLQNRANRRQVAEHVHEGLGIGSPPYLSIKGNSFTLVDSNGELEAVKTADKDGPYVDVVIIDTAPPSRVYWGKDRPFDPSADSYQAPECFSDNGIGASRNAANPQSELCQTCPQNVWGSATSKVTGKPVKACTVMKKVAVLVFASGQPDKEGVYHGDTAADFPFLLRVPVMSHDKLRAYSDKFRGQPFDVSDVVTRIRFVHGAVGQLDFVAMGFIIPELNAEIDKVLATKITDALVGRGDQPITAPSAELIKPVQQWPQERVEPPQQAPQELGVTQGVFAPAEPAKRTRGRPRKNGGESSMPASAPKPNPPFAPQQGEIQTGSVAQSNPIPRAPFTLQNQASHGIVSDASAPPEEVQQNLASIFNLDTTK